MSGCVCVWCVCVHFAHPSSTRRQTQRRRPQFLVSSVWSTRLFNMPAMGFSGKCSRILGSAALVTEARSCSTLVPAAPLTLPQKEKKIRKWKQNHPFMQGMTPSAPRVLKGFGLNLFAAGVFLKAKLNSHRASCGMLQTAPMQTQDCMGECLRMDLEPSLASYIKHIAFGSVAHKLTGLRVSSQAG